MGATPPERFRSIGFRFLGCRMGLRSRYISGFFSCRLWRDRLRACTCADTESNCQVHASELRALETMIPLKMPDFFRGRSPVRHPKRLKPTRIERGVAVVTLKMDARYLVRIRRRSRFKAFGSAGMSVQASVHLWEKISSNTRVRPAVGIISVSTILVMTFWGGSFPSANACKHQPQSL